jgi:hypothetical protein
MASSSSIKLFLKSNTREATSKLKKLVGMPPLASREERIDASGNESTEVAACGEKLRQIREGESQRGKAYCIDTNYYIRKVLAIEVGYLQTILIDSFNQLHQ